MAEKIIMPQGGQDIMEGRVLRWLKAEGDPVQKDEVFCEVETEKAVFEVESPADGVLLKIIAREGEKVPTFSVIGIVGEPGEAIDPEMLALAATLHDIGKVGIPDSILLKPGRLSDAEYQMMKQHTEIGANALAGAMAASQGATFLQAAHDIGDIGSEHAAIGVHLVNNNHAQVGEESPPAAVIRENALVQHVGVGENDVAPVADFSAQALRRVTIIRPCHKSDTQTLLVECIQPPQLVLGKRFQRENIKASGVRLILKPFQDRQVIDHGFTAGRRRGHNHIFTVPNLVDSPVLVLIQFLNPDSLKGPLNCRRVL